MGTSHSRRRALRDRTAELIGQLGDKPDEVARSLEAVGVRGSPGDPFDCAIAVYLSAVVTADPGVYTVSVHARRIAIIVEGLWRRPIAVRLPAALCEFIARFDRYGYPSLVRPEWALDARLEGPDRNAAPQPN